MPRMGIMQSKANTSGVISSPRYMPGQHINSVFRGRLPGCDEQILFAEDNEIEDDGRGFSALCTTADEFFALISSHIHNADFRENIAEDILAAIYDLTYKPPKQYRESFTLILQDYMLKEQQLNALRSTAIESYTATTSSNVIPDDFELISWLATQGNIELATDYQLANEAELVSRNGFLEKCNNHDIVTDYFKELTKSDSNLTIGHKSALCYASISGINLYIWKQSNNNDEIHVIHCYDTEYDDSSTLHIITDDSSNYSLLTATGILGKSYLKPSHLSSPSEVITPSTSATSTPLSESEHSSPSNFSTIARVMRRLHFGATPGAHQLSRSFLIQDDDSLDSDDDDDDHTTEILNIPGVTDSQDKRFMELVNNISGISVLESGNIPVQFQPIVKSIFEKLRSGSTICRMCTFYILDNDENTPSWASSPPLGMRVYVAMTGFGNDVLSRIMQYKVRDLPNVCFVPFQLPYEHEISDDKKSSTNSTTINSDKTQYTINGDPKLYSCEQTLVFVALLMRIIKARESELSQSSANWEELLSLDTATRAHLDKLLELYSNEAFSRIRRTYNFQHKVNHDQLQFLVQIMLSHQLNEKSTDELPNTGFFGSVLDNLTLNRYQETRAIMAKRGLDVTSYELAIYKLWNHFQTLNIDDMIPQLGASSENNLLKYLRQNTNLLDKTTKTTVFNVRIGEMYNAISPFYNMLDINFSETLSQLFNAQRQPPTNTPESEFDDIWLSPT